MKGTPLFAIGLYTLTIAALGIEPTVSGGLVCAGLGLICMIVSSMRGDYD